MLWPRQKVKEGYMAIAVATADGKVIQGYKLRRDRQASWPCARPRRASRIEIAKADIEEVREQGTLMPEGLAEAMTPAQRRDLVRFLLELGQSRDGERRSAAGTCPRPGHLPLRPQAAAAGALAPLGASGQPRPRLRLLRQGGRVLPQAADRPLAPAPLPRARRRQARPLGKPERDDLGRRPLEPDRPGSVLSGVFRGKGLIVPKGVCVRLGERGEMAACFNPETL